jgi:AraC-like DNA-binding protein
MDVPANKNIYFCKELGMTEGLISPLEKRQYIPGGQSDPIRSGFTSVYAGAETIAPGSRTKGHLDSFAIVMTLSGEAGHHSNNSVLRYSPRSFLLMVGELDYFETTEEVSWRSCWLILSGPLAETLIESIGCRSSAQALENLPNEVYRSFLQCVTAIIQPPREWKWDWMKKIVLVFEYICKSIPKRREASSISFLAQKIMRDHLDDPLGLDRIADMLSVSESQLAHQFRKETGTSPARFYRQLRIECAKQFLAEGLPINEVSDQMGFENPFHFSRVFKQTTGVSPSQFKDQIAVPPFRQLQLKKA